MHENRQHILGSVVKGHMLGVSEIVNSNNNNSGY